MVVSLNVVQQTITGPNIGIETAEYINGRLRNAAGKLREGYYGSDVRIVKVNMWRE